MRLVYTLGLYCLIPFIVLRLYWKARRLPAYRQRIQERFGFSQALPAERYVWVHAVSLGEVVAAVPLIEVFLRQKQPVLVTTMTPTGSEQVRRSFGSRVAHQYLPYDLPWVLRRFFKQASCCMGIIMETELWPNLVIEATNAGVPLFLANARISDKAFRSYRFFAWFFKPILTRFRLIMAQSALDAERFEYLGAQCVQVLGNMKFDVPVPEANEQAVSVLKQAWGEHRLVLLAASTHRGEEAQLFAVLPALQAVLPGVILLIAPRHPERFHEVYALAQQQGFDTGRRTELSSLTATNEVVILDCLGELLSFYAISDYAFVGGSLVPVGGHNVLEPIALNVPVFCGQFMRNSQSIVNELRRAEAIEVVQNATELVSRLSDLHRKPSRRTHQVQQARAVWRANQGSVRRHVDAIEAERMH